MNNLLHGGPLAMFVLCSDDVQLRCQREERSCQREIKKWGFPVYKRGNKKGGNDSTMDDGSIDFSLVY